MNTAEKVTAEIRKELENRMFHARSVLDYLGVPEAETEQDEVWTFRKKRTGEVTTEDDKNAVAYRRFWAAMSTPKVDFYNTVVTAEAVREAFPEWIQAGNSRLMHNSQSAGRVFPEDYQVLTDAIRIGISIPRHKTDILNDIDASLLRGVSLGFWPDWDMATWDRKTGVITFHRIRIAEVSIVDAGATPGTDLMEERRLLFDKAMNFVRNKTGNGEKPPMEDFEMEMKEVLEQLRGIVDNAVGGLQTQITELRTAVSEMKPKETETPEDQPTASEKRLMDKIAEQEKSLNEIRSMFTTEEALSPEHIQSLETLVQDRDKEPENTNVPFAFGCIRSNTVSGGHVLRGEDLIR